MGVPSLSSLFSLFSVSSLLHFSLLPSLISLSSFTPLSSSTFFSLSLYLALSSSLAIGRGNLSHSLSLSFEPLIAVVSLSGTVSGVRALCHSKHLLKHRCQLSNSHSQLNRWDCLLAPCRKVRMLLSSPGPWPLHN